MIGIGVSHTLRMVNHMKTTLNIDDSVMARLKQEAARQGRTMSELVETALRMLFRARRSGHDLPPLPTFASGERGSTWPIGTRWITRWKGASVRGRYERDGLRGGTSCTTRTRRS